MALNEGRQLPTGSCGVESHLASGPLRLPQDQYPAEGSQPQERPLFPEGRREGGLPQTGGALSPPEAIPTHGCVWAEEKRSNIALLREGQLSEACHRQVAER